MVGGMLHGGSLKGHPTFAILLNVVSSQLPAKLARLANLGEVTPEFPEMSGTIQGNLSSTCRGHYMVSSSQLTSVELLSTIST
jgi:hypothetical protein